MFMYIPVQVHTRSMYWFIPRFASTGYDNVSGTSWTGLKSVSTSQLAPYWGQTIRCVDGRQYSEVLHEDHIRTQSQETTTNQCDIPHHNYIICICMFDAKGKSKNYRNESNYSNHSNTPLFQEKCLIIAFQVFKHPRLKLLSKHLHFAELKWGSPNIY